MTTATQTESRVSDLRSPMDSIGVHRSDPSPESRRAAKGLPLGGLFAEWRKLSPNLAIEPLEGETPAQAERRVRLAWTSDQLKSRKLKVETWNELSQNEARFLLKKMREESGDGPAYRTTLIARLAVELFGSDWDAILGHRLCERFRVFRPQLLEPHQAHEMIEELLSRIARRDGVDIEEVRARFARSRKSKVESQKVER